MKIIANAIEVNSYIIFNNTFCKVIEKTHTKPGKGHAYVQIVLKNLQGTKLSHRFCSSDTVEPVYTAKKTYNFCYEERNVIYLSEENDPSQIIEITQNDISKQAFEYLKDFGQDNLIYIEYGNDIIMDLFFANSIETVVSWAESYMKGQTASATYKRAKIVNDKYEIATPVYIEKNDKILVNLYGDSGIEFIKRI